MANYDHPVGHQARADGDRHAVDVADPLRHGAADQTGTATDAFVAAVASLRQGGTPYHLGLGLVDFATYVADTDPARADAILEEAEGIAEQLKCVPIQRRAAALRNAAVTT